MKAWLLHGINDLQLADVPVPKPEADEILVQVMVAGICPSDVQRVFTIGAYHYPIILGHEFCGITSDGRRVAVFPLIACHTCESCKWQQFETCSDYGYIGSRQNGAFAEYVSVPKWNLIDLPDNVTFEEAALFEPAAVALHAAKMIPVNGIAKVAVIGNGTIGRLIGIWLKHFGAENVDLLGRNDKGTFVDYDVCVEAVGLTEAFRRCLNLVRPNGLVISVGNPDTTFVIDQQLYWQILRKQITLRGSWNSSFPADWQFVLENIEILQLDRFISHRYKLESLFQALEMIYYKHERHGKAVVELSNPVWGSSKDIK